MTITGIYSNNICTNMGIISFTNIEFSIGVWLTIKRNFKQTIIKGQNRRNHNKDHIYMNTITKMKIENQEIKSDRKSVTMK